jgi:outer membrane lipoprotein-sorting protein
MLETPTLYTHLNQTFDSGFEARGDLFLIFMRTLSRFRLVLLISLVLPATGCLFHSRKVERQVSTAPLKTASQQELIAAINEQANKIHALQATVDIDTSVGGAERGKITDYKQIRGYVLLRKPAMLRMIGLLPIVRNKAFDMVSDGKKFELWIPPKNKFVMGANDVVVTNPQQPMENIRPQAIYDALLVHSVDPSEIAVLENGFETVLDSKRHRVEQPDYELDVIGKGEKGWYLSRKIIFSRTDLLPRRQLLYNQNSELVTEATYDDYKDQAGLIFPNSIEIYRPVEEYDITLTMVKLQLNENLTDDQFVLQQPPGAEVVHLDRAQPPNQPGGGAAPNTK